MTERPIIMTAESVRAILDGTKTQTRRVIKPQFNKTWGQGVRNQDPDYFCVHVDIREPNGEWRWLRCPYGKVGDRLWVRETWRVVGWDEDFWGATVGYRVGGKYEWHDFPDEDRWQEWLIDETGRIAQLPGVTYNEDTERYDWGDDDVIPWKSPLFMPRWASRIALEITGIKVERLHRIGELSAKAEGVTPKTVVSVERAESYASYGAGFVDLWDSINGKAHPWESNPWVWAISFRRIDR